jgi:hypothetical protein
MRDVLKHPTGDKIRSHNGKETKQKSEFVEAGHDMGY